MGRNQDTETGGAAEDMRQRELIIRFGTQASMDSRMRTQLSPRAALCLVRPLLAQPDHQGGSNQSRSVSSAGCRSLTPHIRVVFYSLQDASLGFLMPQLWEGV